MNDSAMPNLPGFGAIAESMELVRKMWGGTGAPGVGFPGMTAPSLSVEEIDKQIADLKAVEAWLTLNMNMLRGTIQALEVQSATISALKSMGEAFKNAGKATASANKPGTGFSFPFGYPAQPEAPASSSQGADESSSAIPSMGASLADPTAWWNMLQSQFKQAVTAATSATHTSGNHGTDGAKGNHSAESNHGADGSPSASNSDGNNDNNANSTNQTAAQQQSEVAHSAESATVTSAVSATPTNAPVPETANATKAAQAPQASDDTSQSASATKHRTTKSATKPTLPSS